MLVVCKRWASDGNRLLYWSSSTSFSSRLGFSTVGHWGPKSPCLPLALNSASCHQLTQTVCVLVILLFNVHQLPLFFRLVTQVHLLIDGSVECQSITIFLWWLQKNICFFLYIDVLWDSARSRVLLRKKLISFQQSPSQKKGLNLFFL